jgi:hypothetical protein
MTSEIETTFAMSPALQSILIDESRVGQRGRPLKGLQRRNTILARRFENGSLKIVPAKAPRNLRRHNVRYLIVDECDAMQNSSEGDTIALAEKRTLSFADRKIIMGSTPLDLETSHIIRAYERSDQRIFELPCPECGTFCEIEWGHIEWEPDRPETAAFRCPHCAILVDESFKPQMLAEGHWRPLRPEVASPCRVPAQCACIAFGERLVGPSGGGVPGQQGRSGDLEAVRLHRFGARLALARRRGRRDWAGVARRAVRTEQNPGRSASRYRRCGRAE